MSRVKFGMLISSVVAGVEGFSARTFAETQEVLSRKLAEAGLPNNRSMLAAVMWMIRIHSTTQTLSGEIAKWSCVERAWELYEAARLQAEIAGRSPGQIA